MVEFQKLNSLKTNPTAGLYVIEASLQGVLMYKGFAETFPKAYDLYLKTCLFNYKDRLGKVLLVEEDDKKLAIIFTRMKLKENEDVIIDNFKKGLLTLLQVVPSDIFIYSPFLGRKEKMTQKYISTIRSVQHQTNEASRVWRFFNERV